MDGPAKTVAGPTASAETGQTGKTAKTAKTGRTVDSYRTPTRILLPKMLVSRDGWKRKAGERKVKLKAATIKIRDLEASRQDWKEQAQKAQGESEQLREQLRESQRRLEEAQAEVARLQDGAKKKLDTEPLSLPARGGQFSVTIVRLAIDLVLDAGASIRGAAASLAVVVSRLGLDFSAPSFGAIRSWLLRVGCYALTCALPCDTEWIWLVNHAVQIGAQKLLVIAGCPLAEAPFGERSLRVNDLSLIGLVPMTESTGELVGAELERVVARTGEPRAIVSDNGSDINGGVAAFQVQHPQTVHIHDAAHHGANVLKNRWEKDARWQAFVQQLPQTGAKVRQTPEAYLLPPTLRPKARFMNVGPLLRFAERVLRLLDQPAPAAKVEEKYGWLRDYRAALAGWRCEYEIVQAAIRQVRLDGVSPTTLAAVEAEWPQGELTPGARDVKARMRTFVREAGKQAQPGERLVGSTEVLESAFGKLKNMERSQSGAGFTGLALSLGAMMSEGEEENIRKALDEVPKKEAEGWAQRLLGHTVQWFRRRFLKGEPVPNPG